MTIKELKIELKALAQRIRDQRNAWKDGHRNLSSWEKAHPDWSLDWRSPVYKERYQKLYATPYKPEALAHEFREKHVVYCLARGRKYEQIEPKVREGNELDMSRIEKMLQGVTREPQVVCAGA